jgi:alkylhydroperoxidase family enzyme
MARIATAPAKGLFRKYAYRTARRRYDRELEPVGVMGHNATVLAAAGSYEQLQARAHQADERLKSLAEAKTALLVGCEFCIDISAYLSAKNGVTDEQLLALPRHREEACFSELERLVLDYAEAMTRTPVAVTDELFDALQAQLDEGALVELTAAIAWENWRARFNWAFDIGAAGFREGAACPVPVALEQTASAA